MPSCFEVNCPWQEQDSLPCSWEFFSDLGINRKAIICLVVRNELLHLAYLFLHLFFLLHVSTYVYLASPTVAVPAQIPLVEDCFQGSGTNYRGTASLTISGKKCQRWSSMAPHHHSKTPEKFPLAYVYINLHLPLCAAIFHGASK